MRLLILTTAIAGTLGLGGCGKKTEAVMPQAPVEQAAAPADKTPQQVKAMLASLPAPYSTADVEDGKRQFGQCMSCHVITKGGANMTGPHLYGVVGRKAGSVADFNYSDAVKTSGFTWDAATLDKWLAGPRAVLPETKMSFIGIKDPAKRANLIAWLRTQADS